MTTLNYESWKQCPYLANNVASSITQKKFELESTNQQYLDFLNRTHNAWSSMGFFFVEEPYRLKEKELANAEQALISALKQYAAVFEEYDTLVQHTRMDCEEIERSFDHHV